MSSYQYTNDGEGYDDYYGHTDHLSPGHHGDHRFSTLHSTSPYAQDSGYQSTESPLFFANSTVARPESTSHKSKSRHGHGQKENHRHSDRDHSSSKSHEHRQSSRSGGHATKKSHGQSSSSSNRMKDDAFGRPSSHGDRLPGKVHERPGPSQPAKPRPAHNRPSIKRRNAGDGKSEDPSGAWARTPMEDDYYHDIDEYSS